MHKPPDIRAARLSLGYETMTEAAEAAGLSVSTWHRFEQGEGGRRLAVARAVADVLHLPVVAVLRAQGQTNRA